ncbi:hypothetical protein [Flavobacterium sp. SM2513]|uniref:hypothetical protein n=1 Tax=Flavobacterium sp. SM2513 TaxID=3424766 RepID=UPI003D7F8DB6
MAIIYVLILFEIKLFIWGVLFLKTVDKIEFPEKTITVDFEQTVKDRKSETMMLTVKNPFDKIMTYEAHMFIVGRDDFLSTSIIPIWPNLTNFEMWSDVIVTLILDNWKWTTK